jgi:hypothetical protein
MNYFRETTGTNRTVSFSDKIESVDIPNRDELLTCRHNVWYTSSELKTIHSHMKREISYMKLLNMDWPINKCMEELLLGNFTRLCIIQPLVTEIVNSIFSKIDLEL